VKRREGKARHGRGTGRGQVQATEIRDTNTVAWRGKACMYK